MKNSGFTLIELLVVVAIIGILAGIVLSSLGAARNKGGDASVQGNLGSIRHSAELYILNNGNYVSSAVATTTSCLTASGMFTDAKVKNAISAAVNGGGGTVACAANTSYWVVAAQLKSNSSNWWCVSSVGSSTLLTNRTTGNILNLGGTVGNSCL